MDKLGHARSGKSLTFFLFFWSEPHFACFVLFCFCLNSGGNSDSHLRRMNECCDRPEHMLVWSDDGEDLACAVCMGQSLWVVTLCDLCFADIHDGDGGSSSSHQGLKSTAKWAVSLENLLEDPEGVKRFRVCLFIVH